MANRFVRSIRQVRNIKKLPLNTTEQNDLISDTKGNVYVRTQNTYVRITGANDIEMNQSIQDLQNQINALEPNDTNTYRDIKYLKEEVNKIKKSINNGSSDGGNYDKQIEHLQNQIDELSNQSNDGFQPLIDDLQAQINDLRVTVQNIKVPDYTEDIEQLKTDIENLPTYDEDIGSLNTRIDDLVEKIEKSNQPKQTEVLKGIDLQSKTDLQNVPIGFHYINGKNNISEMATYNGWLTVFDTGIVRKIEFQPYNHAKVFRTVIYNDKLYDWEWTLTNID